ncbi:phenylacetate--CoA ligase family protein [Actinomadura madurae]|uniref:phenylacetate--CoA ligase family protein n=1 Tax=Actinomadura madurae TaxID=1993 RepID=UPI00202753B4|nr:phenylacetate--CoA ligase [Actinomadura madurae]MCP9949532.1 phenylacetate--CoA ligase [Actinomadura madurae]MCP9966288.1 phenylacetate--CoA ligase [Actinomadura madurae]MCP9978777.1 phenylacetate--CoA ligase [Actinomadura madurae]MCQ0009701.1 phenylacetate--CoA ligase [Actinomadura madurae]MCQ0014967.1 phenylacetate--CoA ligase [Actinomadura madurae]
MFDPKAEAMSLDERAALQRHRLWGMVDRLLAADGVQGRRLKGTGVEGGSDVTLAELRNLPFTTKQDLWDNYPFGMLAVPRDQVAAVHGSSGTRGRPTLVAYTRADLDLWAAMCARSLSCAGASPGSIVHNAYGYGLFTGGIGIHQGAVAFGATVVPMSGGMTDRQVRMLADLRADILTCTPAYALRLGEAVAEAGVELPALKAGLFGAEPWSEELRTAIEDVLPIKAMDIYGLSEVIGPGVATECLEQDGLHVNEDHFIVEAVDPATGEPVEDGTPGELVFTTPTKQALPLLRYRTGDIASLTRGECPCGRTLVRMSKVLGRADDMLVVRGVNVYPSEVERVLLGSGLVRPHYQLVVDRRSPSVRLLVACEALSGDPKDALAHALHETLGLTAEVAVLPAGTVPRVEVGKAVRVVVWEDGGPPLPGLA